MVDRCRSCGAPIRWVRTAATGNLMPIDPDPIDDGNVEIVEGGAIVHGSTPMFHGPLYVAHFATCPDADEWRSQRAEFEAAR